MTPRLRAGALLALVALAIAIGAVAAGRARSAGEPGVERETTVVEPPPKARDVLAEIARRGGEPPTGYVGGRRFENRERRLPPGRYREYDVNPRVRGRDRGPERLVIEGRTGRAYYTPDHYRTFIPIE